MVLSIPRKKFDRREREMDRYLSQTEAIGRRVERRSKITTRSLEDERDRKIELLNKKVEKLEAELIKSNKLHTI